MLNPKRKIAVVTGSRAEYGVLRRLLLEIKEDRALELQLIVTGMHLSPDFGLTYREIEADGFSIDERVEMLVSSDTPVGTCKSVGLGIIGFADAFSRLQPDAVVVIGDRFEILAAAQAAMISLMPLAHISGGEVTEGAIDDAIRHAITKLSFYHFAAAEVYRERIIQMGEAPDRVINCGDPGLDNILELASMTLPQLESDLGFVLGPKFLLVTYHPVTLGNRSPEQGFAELIAALDRFPDLQILITKPNADAGGRAISKMIDEYVARQPGRVHASVSLGRTRYLSAMKACAAVVGNSSSGLIEAPAMRKATVNIGSRQDGRLKARSVIDCAEAGAEIEAAIRQALAPEFKDQLDKTVSLYGDCNSSHRIKEFLKAASLPRPPIKHFYSR